MDPIPRIASVHPAAARTRPRFRSRSTLGARSDVHSRPISSLRAFQSTQCGIAGRGSGALRPFLVAPGQPVDQRGPGWARRARGHVASPSGRRLERVVEGPRGVDEGLSSAEHGPIEAALRPVLAVEVSILDRLRQAAQHECAKRPEDGPQNVGVAVRVRHEDVQVKAIADDEEGCVPDHDERHQREEAIARAEGRSAKRERQGDESEDGAEASRADHGCRVYPRGADLSILVSARARLHSSIGEAYRVPASATGRGGGKSARRSSAWTWSSSVDSRRPLSRQVPRLVSRRPPGAGR